MVSPVPATTCTSGDRPSSAATSGSSVPTTLAGLTSSGSFPTSIPQRRASAASQWTADGSRLSLHQRRVAVSKPAAALPVSRIVRYSGTSSRYAAAAYTSGRSWRSHWVWPTGSFPLHDGAPPGVRILFGAGVRQQDQVDLLGLVVEQVAADGREGHLRAAGAEVHPEDVALPLSGGHAWIFLVRRCSRQ